MCTLDELDLLFFSSRALTERLVSVTQNESTNVEPKKTERITDEKKSLERVETACLVGFVLGICSHRG